MREMESAATETLMSDVSSKTGRSSRCQLFSCHGLRIVNKLHYDPLEVQLRCLVTII
jgi:hypothetical protein